MLLGCNQRWLETALMQCHTAVQSQFYGRWAVSQASLTICDKYSPPCAARYFHLMLLPEFMLLVLVRVGSLCEMEGCICLGASLVSCLNRENGMFLKPAISTALYHCSWERQGLSYCSPTRAFCSWSLVWLFRPQYKCSMMSSILTSVYLALDWLFT